MLGGLSEMQLTECLAQACTMGVSGEDSGDVCMCVSVQVYMCFVYVCLYYVCVYICIYLCVYEYMCIHVRKCVCMCTYVCACIHVFSSLALSH